MTELDFGPVMIVHGKLKGTVGFYDDDDGNKAIVYLGHPVRSKYVVVKNEYIEPIPSFSVLNEDKTITSYFQRTEQRETSRSKV